MKLPNGYGSVVKLGRGRRKPYAARITVGWTDDGRICAAQNDTQSAARRFLTVI